MISMGDSQSTRKILAMDRRKSWNGIEFIGNCLGIVDHVDLQPQWNYEFFFF